MSAAVRACIHQLNKSYISPFRCPTKATMKQTKNVFSERTFILMIGFKWCTTAGVTFCAIFLRNVYRYVYYQKVGTRTDCWTQHRQRLLRLPDKCQRLLEWKRESWSHGRNRQSAIDTSRTAGAHFTHENWVNESQIFPILGNDFDCPLSLGPPKWSKPSLYHYCGHVCIERKPTESNNDK